MDNTELAGEIHVARRLRVYHFGATLVAIGIALWAVYGVLEIQKTTEHNYTQTLCNQGLLILATQGAWVEEDLIHCSPSIYAALKERHHG